MSTIKIERLGDASPSPKKGGWRKSEAVESTPIVLWRGQDVAAAFYYQWELEGVLGRYQQKIASVDTRAKTWFKTLGSDFPIKLSEHLLVNRDETALRSFDVDHLQVADLDGDGTDELLLPRHQGGVDVYHLAKGRIFSWSSPTWEAKYYTNSVVSVQKAKAGGRESVYFVFSAKRDGDAKIPPEVERAHAGQPTENIVEVSATGVRVIPLLGLPAVVTQIVGVGLLNRPGSNQIDELAVCSRLQGKNETLFSRHSLAGTLIGKVREIYADIALEPRLSFSFLAHSNELVAVGDSFKCVVFVWPEKPVNWFKKVEFVGEGKPFVFRGVVDRKSGNPKALFRRGDNLIAFDSDGRSYRREGERNVAGDGRETVPWMELAPTSPLHRIAQLVLLEGDDDAILVVENRDAGVRELTLKDAREAASKYLDPSYVERTEREFAVTFEHVYDVRRIPDELLGPASPLHSLEDIQRLLPKYYEFKTADLQGRLQIRLAIELTEPFEQKTDIAEPRYRSIPEYKAWLKTLNYDAELRLRVLNGRGVLSDHTLSTTLLYGRDIRTKRAGDRLRIVLPLVREDPKTLVAGFFLLSLS